VAEKIATKPKLCVCGERPATHQLLDLQVCKKCFDLDRNFGVRPRRKVKERKGRK
jgi:hypothetical protein